MRPTCGAVRGNDSVKKEAYPLLVIPTLILDQPSAREIIIQHARRNKIRQRLPDPRGFSRGSKELDEGGTEGSAQGHQ